MAILPNLAQANAELEALRAENARLKLAAAARNIKVSTKGALSIYGIGKWPVTLYASQWRKLLAMTQDIADALEVNAHLLSEKGDETKGD